MGLEASTLYTAGQGASIVGNVVSGLFGAQQGNQQAEYIAAQAQIQQQEAYREAAQKQRQGTLEVARQKLQYLKGGVTLAGSPLVVLADTISQNKQEVEALRSRGDALKRVGLLSAKATRNTGIAGLLGSLITGTKTGLETYAIGKQHGWWDKKQQPPAGGAPVPPPAGGK